MAVRITYHQYQAIARETGRQAAIRTARETTRAVYLAAQAHVPIGETGELGSSGHFNVDQGPGGAVGTVGYRADHAMAVHQGARPHVIVPRDPRGTLVFRANGKLIFTKKVNHPGNRANPWLYEALVRQAGRRGYLVRRTAA